MRRKLIEIRDLAIKSIGIEAGAQSLSTEVSFLVEKLKLTSEQIQTMERILTKLVDASEEGKYLLSIRGLNYIAVAGLLAELGCFKPYRSANK